MCAILGRRADGVQADNAKFTQSYNCDQSAKSKQTLIHMYCKKNANAIMYIYYVHRN